MDKMPFTITVLIEPEFTSILPEIYYLVYTSILYELESMKFTLYSIGMRIAVE